MSKTTLQWSDICKNYNPYEVDLPGMDEGFNVPDDDDDMVQLSKSLDRISE